MGTGRGKVVCYRDAEGGLDLEEEKRRSAVGLPLSLTYEAGIIV